MADIHNLTGLEKPLTKLIETVSEGLGVVGNNVFKFDSKKIKRIGKAEAEVEKNKIVKRTEGEASALAILDRVGKRFALEQYNKQINLENIIVKSQDNIKGHVVNNKAVNKDWTARFLGIAQDVSREEMQEILAKILAGEVIRPSTYSLRTLELVKDLSMHELSMFKRFVALSSSESGLLIFQPINRSDLEKYGLDFDDYTQFTDIGLLNSNTSMAIDQTLGPGESMTLEAAGATFNIKSSVGKKTLEFSFIRFTAAGAQLASLLKETSRNTKKQIYLTDLRASIQLQGFKIC